MTPDATDILTSRVYVRQLAALRNRAIIDHTSVSAVVRRIIDDWLAQQRMGSVRPDNKAGIGREEWRDDAPLDRFLLPHALPKPPRPERPSQSPSPRGVAGMFVDKPGNH